MQVVYHYILVLEVYTPLRFQIYVHLMFEESLWHNDLDLHLTVLNVFNLTGICMVVYSEGFRGLKFNATQASGVYAVLTRPSAHFTLNNYLHRPLLQVDIKKALYFKQIKQQRRIKMIKNNKIDIATLYFPVYIGIYILIVIFR